MVQFLESAFPGEMIFEHDRDSDEYVYRKDKMITLSGRALHKKKNHLNYFLKNYQYETKPLTTEMTEEVIDFVVQMREGRDYDADEMESLRMEEEAIREIMKFVDRSEVYSTAILLTGQAAGLWHWRKIERGYCS